MKPATDRTISVDELAVTLGVTARTVRNYLSSGAFISAGRGRVDLLATVRALAGRLDEARRAPDSRSAADARLRAAKAAEIETRLAERRKDLIEIGEAEASIDIVCGAFRAALSAMPARFSREVAVRRRLEALVEEVLREVAERIEREMREIGNG